MFAAFLATAAFTVLAVIFGYLSNSIDDELLNYADRRLICFIQEAWHGVYRSAGRYMPIIASTPARPTLESVEATKARQEVLTQFVLTLSDQQLVTGLAMLTAGIMNQKELTVYDFSTCSASHGSRQQHTWQHLTCCGRP